MKVVNAQAKDIGKIIEMSAKFYETTSYKDFSPFNPVSVGMLAGGLIDVGVLLLAVTDDGECVGMAGLLVSPFVFNSDVLIASEVVWWVDPTAQGQGAGKALLAAIEPACKEKGCTSIQMIHLHNSPPQAAMLYERLGYVHTESAYTKVI